MVKFMCQLDWAMGHPVSQSDIILGVLVKVFLNEMNIWIGRLSKADCLPRWMRWASSNKLKIWIKWKGWVRGTSCPPSCWVETLDFSCLDLELTPAALLDPTWRLCLRLHDHASQLPIFSLCVCVSPMGSISRENPIQSPFLQVEKVKSDTGCLQRRATLLLTVRNFPAPCKDFKISTSKAGDLGPTRIQHFILVKRVK